MTTTRLEASDWERRDVVVEGATHAVLLRHAADRGAPTLEYLPLAPSLAVDARGEPRLALTLTLSRPPDTASASVEPLIESAVFALTVTYALPEAVVASIAEPGMRLRPLFAHHAVFTLESGGTPLQQVEASGPEPAGALSLTLDRALALAAIDALSSTPASLMLRHAVSYRTPQAPIEIQGSWANIHDALTRPERPPDGVLTRHELERRLAQAMHDGVIGVQPVVDAAALVQAFLRVSAPLLQPLPARPGDSESRYRLRPRLHPGMQLMAAVQGGDQTDTIAGVTELSRIIGGCLDGRDVDRFVRLIAPDRWGVPQPVPRRVRTRASRGPADGGIGRASLARINGGTLALAAAARPAPALGVNAHALLAAATLQPASATMHLHHWALDDVTLVEPGATAPADRHLPQVDDPAAPLWADRVDASRFWYAPAFVVEMPAANAAPDASPFRFDFHTEGHTASGRPGLNGTITLTLHPTMSEATRTAWNAAGQPSASAVPTLGLSVVLSIPFRDEAGANRTAPFAAELTGAGDTITARVPLLDDWLRLAYGALALPDFQASDATVRVAYTYEAYVPLREEHLDLLFDQKLALTPIRLREAAAGDMPAAAYLDAASLTYRTPLTTLAFTAERREAGVRPRGTRRGAARSVGAASLAEMRVAQVRAAANAHLFAIRPNLSASPALTSIIRRRQYAVQTLGREETQPVLFPCSTLGALYVQDTEHGPVAIGCREAFTLGQITFRAYEKIESAAFANPDYSVWRSLQQPGRFLLVPTRYAIARFAAGDAARAYRPAIFLYSTVDADRPDGNRCVVLASLVPDIAPAALRRLQEQLKTLAERPVMTLVNAVEATAEYDWALPAGSGATIGECRATRLHDSFQVTIACAIDAAPALQTLLQTSGLTGSVEFTLADGTVLQSALTIDLTRIVGPAPEGPVSCEVRGGQCTLVNHIDRAVDVHDILTETAEGVLGSVAVDARLEPAQTLVLDVGEDVTSALATAVPAAADAATIPEIRSFVEDVHTNVAFVNLVNYENHGLARLALDARLRGVSGMQSLDLDEAAPVSALEFVLPLTVYLDDPVLEFAVTRTSSDGTAATTPWIAWPLRAQGNVVSLTWDTIRHGGI